MAKRILVPLKIDVGIDDETGHAKYPSFNLVSSTVRKGMDWSKYVDIHGGGIHYDKTCGHKDESDESPYGHQCCCICVPEDFALEALDMFPNTVSRITETEFEAFYDNKAHAHEPNEKVDTDVLNGLIAQRTLMVMRKVNTDKLDAEIDGALDPDNLTVRGIRKNINKKWATVKANSGIEIK